MARTLGFDPETKLRQAMKLFWKKGYAHTSMAELVEALGINRFSLYNTFGDKRQLYLKALEYYRRTVIRRLVVPLLAPEAGLPEVVAYIERLKAGLLSPNGHWGCFIQITGLELGPSDPVLGRRAQEMLEELEGLIEAALTRAHEQGALDSAIEPVGAARMILHTVQGAMALYRANGDREALAASLDFLADQVKRWARADLT